MKPCSRRQGPSQAVLHMHSPVVASAFRDWRRTSPPGSPWRRRRRRAAPAAQRCASSPTRASRRRMGGESGDSARGNKWAVLAARRAGALLLERSA